MRKRHLAVHSSGVEFLSIQAQDFIEDDGRLKDERAYSIFLSIQAQDFIEESSDAGTAARNSTLFLSIQAQDFIEE